MGNIVNELGVIHVIFQRIEHSSDLPRWKWYIEFNPNQYLRVENEGTSWAVTAACTMEQLSAFMELHPALAPVIMKLRLSWSVSYPVEKLIQKWKEKQNETNTNTL